ncbi:MAG: hypothetical protein V3S98_03870 [Dehalococcoidia bacterium]
MMFLKACNRCGGDLHETEDMYGAYQHCLQCGNIIEVASDPEGLIVKRDARKTSPHTEVAA